MSQLIAENWILLVIALIIGLVVAWYLFRSTRRTRVSGTSRDVLDDGAAPAERNRALIDTPPAADRKPVPHEPVIAPDAPGATGAAIAMAVDTGLANPVEAPAASAVGSDDITRIKGVGPKLAALLAELGVTGFAQIAAWDDAEIDRIDAQLGRFEGRIRRDDWVGQAALLASGKTEDFARKYGAGA